MEIRPDLKEPASGCNRFMTRERLSLLFASGLVIYGVGIPAALEVDDLSPEFLRFFLLPASMTLYLYLASRVGAYIGRRSCSDPFASGSVEEASDLLRRRAPVRGSVNPAGEGDSGEYPRRSAEKPDARSS